MFDLNASHIFVCVVEEQGFTAASQKLGIPKQTISRRINELEETLGVRLLERSTRKIRMTSVGELFFSHAQQIVHTAELAEESVLQTKLEPSGTLHLATSQLFLELTLQHVILEYMKRYPKVTIKVTLADSHLDLYNQNIDVGFVVGPLKDSSVISKRLANTWLNCLASPLYLETHGRPETPKDLQKMPVIMYTEPLYGPSNIWHFETWKDTSIGKSTQDITLDGSLHTPSFWLAREAALQGLGVAKLPSSILHHEIKTGQLVDVFEDWRIVETTLYAIFPSRKMLSLPVRTFLDLLDKAMPQTQTERPSSQQIQDSPLRVHPPRLEF